MSHLVSSDWSFSLGVDKKMIKKKYIMVYIGIFGF